MQDKEDNMPKYKRFIFWRDGLNEPKIDYRIEEAKVSWSEVLAKLTRAGWTGIKLIETEESKSFSNSLQPEKYKNHPQRCW